MILAIDPGSTQSGFVEYFNDGSIGQFGKYHNGDVLELIQHFSDATHIAIESIASYGMAVGAEVFETCVWSGRFIQHWLGNGWSDPIRIYRREVKLHLCNSPRAKDGNVRQAIIDRYGGKEQAIGKKATPGPLYGISGDVWQALGVAITAHETRMLHKEDTSEVV